MTPPKMFGLSTPLGRGAGTPTPASIYGSNVNPALTNAGATPTAAPAAPAVPAAPGSNILKPGGVQNPFLQALQQMAT